MVWYGKALLMWVKQQLKPRVDINSLFPYNIFNCRFIMKFDPHHPAADAEGYVKYPNITREIERADAAEAQRGYEANLSIMEVTGSLTQKTIEAIGR